MESRSRCYWRSWLLIGKMLLPRISRTLVSPYNCIYWIQMLLWFLCLAVVAFMARSPVALNFSTRYLSWDLFRDTNDIEPFTEDSTKHKLFFYVWQNAWCTPLIYTKNNQALWYFYRFPFKLFHYFFILRFFSLSEEQSQMKCKKAHWAKFTTKTRNINSTRRNLDNIGTPHRRNICAPRMLVSLCLSFCFCS